MLGLRSCCLPGGLRRPVSVGLRGAAARWRAGPSGEVGRALADRLAVLRAPPPPPLQSPGSGGPGLPAPVPCLWWRCGARQPGVGADPERRGGKAPAPFGQSGGRWRQDRVALRLGGFGALEESRWPRAAGWGLQPRGWGASPGQAQAPQMEQSIEGGAEEDSGEGEHLHRALYPSQRPSPFHCQADSGLFSKEQLLDSWQNNGDPFPAPSSWDRR